ncbi:MAG: type III pantothenate kinase [Candidatus Nitricoxidivorans perseverans]|uniref:Type III pantothenate kinase n=1 Tax=Candidatus Nitricoxidivorans perseverans TaxID=2975601 RepID=A0AA49FJS9_9PROT|nr:MAG: type III pantothenate kinase [Candidatus Nitricoxidivorans perseverans]
MILCIDCGNTRLKWGLREGGAWLAQGALPLAEAESLDEVLPRRPSRAIACNVAGPAVAQAVVLAADRLGAPLDWIHAHAEQCGVRNGYEHPQQLGADRWAALIGARAAHDGPAVIVMCGTATTIDVLDADGRHRGGLILPGLDMMRASLAAGTADLSMAAGQWRDLPTNTLDAIATGCINATVGAIERMPPGFVLLSGGAAAAISPHLTLPHRLVENLVLEGLARVAEA